MSDDGSTMTDLLSRTEPSSTPTDPGAPPPPSWLAGAGAGLAAATAGLVVCLGFAALSWLGGSGGSMMGALRVGASAWLLGHGSGLRIAGGAVDVAPVGLTAAALVMTWFAGRWSADVARAASLREVATVAGAVSVSYATVIAVVSVLAADSSASAWPVRATAAGLLIAAAAATLGACAPSGAHRLLLERLPVDPVPVLRGSATGAAALFGCGAITLAISLVGHIEQLQRLLQSLDLGVVGGLLLVVACVVVLPNAVLFAVAVLVGPGFVLGTDTSVTAASADLGAVPAVPWFAALPTSGHQPVWVSAVAALPLLCGVLAGVVSVRARPVERYRWACARGGLAGALAGCAVAALLAVSGGSIGPGRMADVGPQVLACLAVAVVAMGSGGVIGGAGARLAART